MTAARNLLCLAALALPAAAGAQPIEGPYVSLGGGGNFAYDQTTQPNGFGPVPHSYIFDPGGAVAAAIGYGLGNGLRLEAEGDYADNHVHGTLEPPGFGSHRAGGYEQQYGGFGNVLYDLPFALPVRPYVGLGAGYQEVELDHVNASPFGSVIGRGDYAARGNFAYQAIAGLAVPTPAPGLSLTLEYRFIGVLSPGAYYRGNGFDFAAGAYEREHATFSNIFDNEILFGLRYAFNSAPPPSPPAPIAAPAPAPAPARTYLVFFEWDSAVLTPRAAEVVAEAARNAARTQTTTVEVDGYADTSHALPGERGQSYNFRLSLRRADRVRAELVRDGVPSGVIEVHGFGDTHLLVPTGSNTREPQNRRVKIVLH